ncbi:transposable element Tc1 transposase [Trichonephila clavipes]|nr:transposable element Tc1 transposase [Trichonephila clavipes]
MNFQTSIRVAVARAIFSLPGILGTSYCYTPPLFPESPSPPSVLTLPVLVREGFSIFSLTLFPLLLFALLRSFPLSTTNGSSVSWTGNRRPRHLDAFTRGRIIGKLEEGRSVTSVAAEFGIAHSIVSRLWRQFQTTGTAIRGFSSGRPRGTTPADDRYIVLQARRNRRQTAGEIARHTTQATGRPISRFTVARRLHGGGLFARRPVRCAPLTPAHRRRRYLWCREHRNWRDNEWGRVLFTD